MKGSCNLGGLWSQPHGSWIQNPQHSPLSPLRGPLPQKHTRVCAKRSIIGRKVSIPIISLGRKRKPTDTLGAVEETSVCSSCIPVLTEKGCQVKWSGRTDQLLTRVCSTTVNNRWIPRMAIYYTREAVILHRDTRGSSWIETGNFIKL